MKIRRRKNIRRKSKAGKSQALQALSKDVRIAARNAAQAEQMADELHSRADQAHRGAEETHQRVKQVRANRIKGSAKSKSLSNSPSAKLRRSGRMGAAERRRLKETVPEEEPASALPFQVVGIGASAGGYEALSELLGVLPEKSGMAYVVVPHLDPHRESNLTELLAKVSRTPVVVIKNGVVIERDRVYVLPSNTSVVMERDRLKLRARAPEAVPMPIDIFFRSLARQQETRAIGILLSGMGTDGSLGIGEIKGQGGITFAQDKASAKFYAMPASAIESGAIDFVLPPEGIARELERLTLHPYVARQGRARPLADEPQSAGESLFKTSPDDLRELFGLLRIRSGVDFSLYKPGTLNRRVMRRMMLRRADALSAYVRMLQEEPDEVEALFHDLLISVTGFFRDPAMFRALQNRILPRLLKGRKNPAPLRAWSCGCATGEETYSLAIVVTEAMEKLKRPVQVQIFGSDLSERAIQKARAGIYQENILLDVPAERLRRFFVKVDGQYQVNKHIRDMCIFARQNVATEPPFSNLDLISCRNVLIYLSPALQRRIIPVFHYALKPGGYLMLGSSETIGEHSDLFELVDKRNKVYVKKTAAYRPALEFEGHSTSGLQAVTRSPAREVKSLESDPANLQQKVDRLLLAQFSPAGVVINAQMDALQFRGKTGLYLEHQQGAASLNLLKMMHEDLALDLRRAVTKAVQTGQRVNNAPLEFRANGEAQQVRIEVMPLSDRHSSDSERFFLVLFHDVTPRSGDHQLRPRNKGEQRKADVRQISRLKEELSATKESLQAIIEEQEATNEELKSANEEIQSSNEELQSTNEELETAREELQSTNEELTTLNQELHNRNSELSQLNNDLTNLLSSVHIAVIMLGTDFRIRRYTPVAEKMFNLIHSDIGRRLGDLNRNINIPDLEEVMKRVIDDLTVVEREVQDRDGHWYSLRIRPYRTQESVIDGVVLMLLDVDELKRSIRQMVGSIPHPLLLLYGDLRINRANEKFCAMFDLQENEVENRSVYEIGQEQWDFPAFRQLLQETLPRQGEVRDFRIEHSFGKVGEKKLLVNARRFYEESRGVQFVLMAFQELPP